MDKNKDLVDLFKGKLNLVGVNSPSADVIGRLGISDSRAMEIASHPSMPATYALELYQAAKNRLGTTTRSQIVNQAHISINGEPLLDPASSHVCKQPSTRSMSF